MCKFFKRLFSIVLLTAALVTAFTLPAWAAGPPNIVTNGDFSDGLNHWTNSGTRPWTVSGGVATVTVSDNDALITQCIRITHQPIGNNWTLSVNGTIVGPGYGYVFAEFWSDQNCGGSWIDYQETPLVWWSSIEFWEDPAARSVQVGVWCQDYSGVSTCTADDFYLGGESATAVTLAKLNARPREFQPLILLPLSLVLFGLVVILRRVVRARNAPSANEMG
jgi:hypothetical protein